MITELARMDDVRGNREISNLVGRNYDFPLDAGISQYRNVTGDNLRLRIHVRGSVATRCMWIEDVPSKATELICVE